MFTFTPKVICPESNGSNSLMIFKIVVFPVPLSPIKATRSPRLISKEISEKSRLLSKDLDRASTVRTSFPLVILGSKRIFISACSSVGFSRRSILFNNFSRLSARLMDFSRLKDFNFVITAS